jgi:hypothetical protein
VVYAEAQPRRLAKALDLIAAADALRARAARADEPARPLAVQLRKLCEEGTHLGEARGVALLERRITRGK